MSTLSSKAQAQQQEKVQQHEILRQFTGWPVHLHFYGDSESGDAGCDGEVALVLPQEIRVRIGAGEILPDLRVAGRRVSLTAGTRTAAYSLGTLILSVGDAQESDRGRGTRDRSVEISLALPGELSVVQRREHVRVDIQLPVAFRLISFGGKPVSAADKVGRGHTTDVSGGGIGFICDLDLPAGLILGIAIDNSWWKPFGEFRLEVKRCRPAGKGRHAVGGKFLDLSDLAREKIIRWVFDEQRRLSRRMKGLV